MGAIRVIWLDAATFFISAISVQLLIPATLVKVDEQTTNTNYWQELRGGFLFVRQHTLILSFAVVVMITNMVDAAMSSVTLPVYAETIYGSILNSLAHDFIRGAGPAADIIPGKTRANRKNLRDVVSRISGDSCLRMGIAFTTCADRDGPEYHARFGVAFRRPSRPDSLLSVRQVTPLGRLIQFTNGIV